MVNAEEVNEAMGKGALSYRIRKGQDKIISTFIKQIITEAKERKGKTMKKGKDREDRRDGQIILPCSNEKATLICINLINVYPKERKILFDLLDKAKDGNYDNDIDYAAFNVQDCESITLNVNGDYFEPHPDSKEGRF